MGTTTTTTTTPAPYKQYQKREAKPEPYPYKSTTTTTTTTTPAPYKQYQKREANPQPQLQLQHHPTKDRRETPPSVLPSSKPTSGSFCYLPSSLKCEYYHTCCRGRNNPNDCPATVSFQCNIPIGAFPRWEVFRVGRYVCY